MEWTNLLLRWIHVVAGIAWIGHLYFFNFVNAQVAKTYDADSKKKVVPELMPRALYWFRWGAAYTWISGFLLAGIVYYMDPRGLVDGSQGVAKGAAMGISFGLILFVFFIYDFLWKALARNETAGIAVSSVLVAVLIFLLYSAFVPRAAAVHVGMLFGTIMAMNVWMRIWPAQRKIIAAIKAGTAPDAALVAMAGLRSKHNTYLSVPLVIAMLSQHHLTILAGQPACPGWCAMMVMVAVGWGAVKLLYLKSAGPAPGRIE